MKKEKKQEDVLTPLNSGFRHSDELDIKITGRDFAILASSAEMMFEANIQQCRPLRYRYYDKNGEYVPSPTKEQFENEELTKAFDPLAFMSANNLVDAYIGYIDPSVLEARKVLFEIQEQGITQGKGVSFETLIAEQEEANKSKLEVVE